MLLGGTSQGELGGDVARNEPVDKVGGAVLAHSEGKIAGEAGRQDRVNLGTGQRDGGYDNGGYDASLIK